jgi:hypothetical protein
MRIIKISILGIINYSVTMLHDRSIDGQSLFILHKWTLYHLNNVFQIPASEGPLSLVPYLWKTLLNSASQY